MWPSFTFPGLNLWNAPLSPEMIRLHEEMGLDNNCSVREPKLSDAGLWYVELVEGGKVVGQRAFGNENEAWDYFYNNEIKWEMIHGY